LTAVAADLIVASDSNRTLLTCVEVE